MGNAFRENLNRELSEIRNAGLYKNELVMTSPQGSHVSVMAEETVINMCANNYLGLAQHPEVNRAACDGLKKWGYGMASVRFICGTQAIHKQLEEKLSHFLGTEETILYPSCFDANAGLYETILTHEDAVVSDALNHASIIDGIRLCKAKRFRYNNNDMADLEEQLRAARKAAVRHILITTDGVFSMDGTIAHLDQICSLAEKYGAMVHFDDCHGTGVIGESGRGTHEYRGAADRIDITTGTLGKTLGGASGGYTSGRREVVELLRQRSRPYLFSNTIAPSVVAGAAKALDLLNGSADLRERLSENTRLFREGMRDREFNLLPGVHPIVPVMFHDASVTAEFAARMLKKGVYVVAFSYPVVPKGMARIRIQISAAHSTEDLKKALQCFSEVREEMRRLL